MYLSGLVNRATRPLLRNITISTMTHKTDDEWRAVLSKEQFRVLRQKGTEAPGTGEFNKHKAAGVYTCAGCNTPLYTSAHKFDSGWYV
jgi:peptide-methionine (R)-S-oxide reductase